MGNYSQHGWRVQSPIHGDTSHRCRRLHVGVCLSLFTKRPFYDSCRIHVSSGRQGKYQGRSHYAQVAKCAMAGTPIVVRILRRHFMGRRGTKSLLGSFRLVESLFLKYRSSPRRCRRRFYLWIKEDGPIDGFVVRRRRNHLPLSTDFLDVTEYFMGKQTPPAIATCSRGKASHTYGLQY